MQVKTFSEVLTLKRTGINVCTQTHTSTLLWTQVLAYTQMRRKDTEESICNIAAKRENYLRYLLSDQVVFKEILR